MAKVKDRSCCRLRDLSASNRQQQRVYLLPFHRDCKGHNIGNVVDLIDITRVFRLPKLAKGRQEITLKFLMSMHQQWGYNYPASNCRKFPTIRLVKSQ
jgi:hypothetical protein